MAIKFCKEVHETRKGSRTQVISEFERIFLIVTDTVLEGPAGIMNEDDPLRPPCLPQIGDQYVDADGVNFDKSYCYKRLPVQDQGDPFTWRVTCEYSSDLSLIPLSAPIKIHWTTQKFQEVVYQSSDLTYTGDCCKAICNSAGEMFDPPPTRDQNRMVLTIVRNELPYTGVGLWDGSRYSPSIALQYMDTVNDAPFFGFDAGQVKCESIVGEEITTGPTTYWVVTYVFHAKSPNWKYRPLDAGFKEVVTNFITGDDVLVSILDNNGRPVAQPWPLNGAGEAVTIDFTHPIMDQLTFLSYTIYESVDFTVWAFPGA